MQLFFDPIVCCSQEIFNEKLILMLLSICLLVYSFLSIQTYTNNILLPFNWLHCIELITHLSVSSNSILISGAAIDLSSLIVVEGKVCWDLYIDGLVVSSDGNLLDALAAAIKVTFWLVLLVTCSFKFHIFLQLFEWSLEFPLCKYSGGKVSSMSL